MTATDILERQFLEMRWRALSLAADLDRIQRAEGGAELLRSDARLATLRSALELLNESTPNRAEQLQLLFSDTTPRPEHPALDQKPKPKNQKTV
jgi:hypothetical protein